MSAQTTSRSARQELFTARMRRILWRSVLTVSGGISVEGPTPTGGCVVVANHSSHADTAALLASIPAAGRPVFIAAADYWSASPVRAWACRAMGGGYEVRRGGGGSADLEPLIDELRAGRTVVVFPEGTRSRDGSLHEFHSGAFRLAERAGVPVVPVGLRGTSDLLPVHGDVHRAAVQVRFGEPLSSPTASRARHAVAALAADSTAHQKGSEMTLITAPTRSSDQEREAVRPRSWLRPLQIAGQALLVAAIVAISAASSIYFLQNFPLWGSRLG